MKRWVFNAVALFVLSVSFSNATASGTVPSDYAVGATPTALVVGDFNGDGRRDLAAAHSGGGNVGHAVSVLLGNPDGTFQAARESAASLDDGPGSTPVSLLSGDLTGDGKADLIVTSAGRLTALLSNGDGTFGPPEPVALPRQSPPIPTGYIRPESAYPAPQAATAIAVGDLNGDGDLDLVVAASTYIIGSAYEYDPLYDATWYQTDIYVNVLLGGGDGTFAPAFVERLGVQPISQLVVGDFNGDGRLDVVGGSMLGVRLGNGDGTLQARVGPYVTPWYVEDYDHDGKLDMLGWGSVQLGVGDGTFQWAEGTPFLTNVWGGRVADVNGDGHLDVVLPLYAATLYGGYVEVYDEWGDLVEYYGTDPVTTRWAAVYLGYGNGTFDRTSDWNLGTFESESNFSDCVLADFDGDGLDDMAATDFYLGVVTVAHNPGSWPRPSPSIRFDDVTVTEGDTGTTFATFTVRILAPYDQEVAVDFATQVIPHAPGARWYADEGVDFTAASGTVRLAPGETSKTIAVGIVGDVLYEYGHEDFRVVLANPTSGASIADGSATCKILDTDVHDDTLVDIGNVSKAEGGSGETPFVFTVTLSRACAVPVTVYFYTVDGTAKVVAKKDQTADYVAVSDSFTLAPWETTRSVTVQVVGDRKREQNETFKVVVSTSITGYVQSSSGTGTILNDD